ncbi:hypothetical protein AB0L40_10880 [Patulibacter sp. NPDC049589]|uniref:hypothetical protein n=1 Tax=Patulibacter sp. NPDC049589 TaxID=3154731 RepID=UPI003423E716
MQRVVPAVLTVLALAAAPALAGCGGDDEAQDASATTTSTAAVPTTTGTTTAILPPKTPADGQQDPASPAPDPGPTETTAPSGPTTELAPPGAKPPAKTPTETTVKRPSDPVWCPEAEGGKGATKASHRFDTRELLGLKIAEATALAKQHACAVRVVRRDGNDLIRTMDFSNARINVTETKGRIVRLNGVG